MATFHRASQERVNAFPVGHRYLFKHFFENRELFDELEPYYDEEQYRFVVRESEIEAVTETLAAYGYGLVVVDDIEEFTVAVPKYTSHPDNVFKDSVDRREDLEYHLFLMKDQVAVEEAEREGAIRISELEQSVVF